MERAFAVDGIFALAEARGHAAFQRPERRRIGQQRPVAGKRGRQAALDGARDAARHGLAAKRIELVNGNLDVLRGYVIGKGEGLGRGRGGRLGGGRGVRAAILAQPVQRCHFAGQRAQRSYLHIAVMRDLRHLLVVLAQRFAFFADLVEALGLQQHAGVRARQSYDRECADEGRGHKAVGVVKRKRDLPHPSLFIPGNKKNVVALAQHALSLNPATGRVAISPSAKNVLMRTTMISFPGTRALRTPCRGTFIQANKRIFRGSTELRRKTGP